MPPPPPRPVAPAPLPPEDAIVPPAAAPAASVKRVAAKELFAADEPLPAFTYPVIDEAQKQELLRRVEEARTQKKPSAEPAEAGQSAPGAATANETGDLPKSSVERVAEKESFAADEPLPAFTYPVIDEEHKQALLRRVAEARAAQAQATAVEPGMSPKPGKMLSELRRMGSDAWARGSERTRRGIDAACAFIDRNRSRLPPRLRDPLSKVKTGVILAAVAVLAFSMLVGVLLLISGGDADEQAAPAQSAAAPPPAPKVDLVPPAIEEAKKQGHAAVEKLTERFPKDHRVWLVLAASHSEQANYAAAVSAVGKALAADPKANQEAAASEVLAVAVRKRDTTDAAFTLLEGPMGSAGATTVYDLSVDPKVPLPIRSRGEEWIRSEAFEKVAEPDVKVAAALRYAKSCNDRHDLLPMAAHSGGQRVLDYLKIVKTGGGCGRGGRKDCFPCMRQDDALKTAIEAIEKRLAGL